MYIARGRVFIRQVVALASLLAVLTGTCFATPVSAQIAWQKDVTQALAAARQQKKYVFLLMTNPARCAPCRRLESTILTQPAVYTFMKKYYLAVKVNADSDYGSALFRRYAKSGSGIPNMAVLAPSGQRMGAMAGCPGDSTAFIRNLTAITSGHQVN